MYYATPRHVSSGPQGISPESIQHVYSNTALHYASDPYQVQHSHGYTTSGQPYPHQYVVPQQLPNNGNPMISYAGLSYYGQGPSSNINPTVVNGTNQIMSSNSSPPKPGNSFTSS